MSRTSLHHKTRTVGPVHISGTISNVLHYPVWFFCCKLGILNSHADIPDKPEHFRSLTAMFRWPIPSHLYTDSHALLSRQTFVKKWTPIKLPCLNPISDFRIITLLLIWNIPASWEKYSLSLSFRNSFVFLDIWLHSFILLYYRN